MKLILYAWPTEMYQISESYTNTFEKRIVWETFWQPYARNVENFFEQYTNM